MIFTVASLVAYVSRFMSLRAGDLSRPARRPAWATARSRRATCSRATWWSSGISKLGVQHHRTVEAK